MALKLHLPLALLALLLTACGSRVVAPSQELNLALSPAAYPAAEAVMACLPTDENLVIRIDSLHPSEVDLSAYAFYIQLGRHPQAQFAAQIATEQIVLAISPAQNIAALGSGHIADLLRGRISSWAEVGGNNEAVLLFLPPASDEVRQSVERNLARGMLSGSAIIATAPRTLLENVAINSGALGILPAAWADDTVRTHALGLSLPVLAQSLQPPQGAARSVLACLQGPTGQAVLAESYAP